MQLDPHTLVELARQAYAQHRVCKAEGMSLHTRGSGLEDESETQYRLFKDCCDALLRLKTLYPNDQSICDAVFAVNRVIQDQLDYEREQYRKRLGEGEGDCEPPAFAEGPGEPIDF